MALLLGTFAPLLMLSLPVAPVTVSTNHPRVQAQENSEAVLSCNFQTERDPNPRIEWKKKEQEVSFVYFNGSFTERYRGRAEIEGATIKLNRVTLKDAGAYRCEVSASEDSVKLGETNITLRVLVPPHTPSCEIPTSVLTGSQVDLHCSDHYSIPPAVYTWYKDRKPLFAQRKANATFSINQNTGVLTFKTVTRDDAGHYHCEARNGVGQPKSCIGNQMNIDDLNIAAIIAGIIVTCLVLAACAIGVYYAHRHGYFSRHRGSPHAGYGPPHYDTQDFKHTQSFML